MKAWHVVQFDTMHSTAESRKLGQSWWVAKPNKHDGMSYCRITAEEDGLALYGAWSAIVEVASKGPRESRGWLIRNGRALGAADLAVLTRFPRAGFERALEFFARQEVGWLAEEEFEGPGAAARQPGGAAREPDCHSEGSIQTNGGTPGDAARKPSVSTDSTERTDSTDIGRDKKGERQPTSQGSTPSLGAVAASRTQWVALTRRLGELKARGEELTGEERAEFKKLRGELRALEGAQAAGKF